jgi:transposase
MENSTTAIPVSSTHRCFVGLDVHKLTIYAAVLPSNAPQVTERIQIPNTPEAVAKLVERLARQGVLSFVYEAGPTGYALHRQLTAMGHACAVIAPAFTPRSPGDQVKTDRRDAEKLAHFHRSGDLRPIYIPTREQEAARDLVRAREDLLGDRTRARQRVSSFLLRQSRVWGQTTWKKGYWVWLKAQRFETPALHTAFDAYVRAVEELEEHLRDMDRRLLDLAEQEPYKTRVKYLRAFKGIDALSALTILVETPLFERFDRARGFMSYTGLVCRERSSGARQWRGAVTKAGNAHIRRVLVEAAWGYRHRSRMSRALTARRTGCPQPVLHIARKAENRLHRKFWRLVDRGMPSQKAVVAVARELSGFIWAMSKEFPQTGVI